MEMIERLFLYRVDGQRTRLGIDLAEEHAPLITTTTANTRLAIGDTTVMGTEQTLYYPTLEFLIIPAFHHKTILNSEYDGFVDVEFSIAPTIPT